MTDAFYEQAMIYYEQEKYQEALKLFQEAYDIRRSSLVGQMRSDDAEIKVMIDNIKNKLRNNR